MNTKLLRAGLGALLAGLSLSAAAQTMYRCGSVYQDRPCEGAQAGKVIGSTGSAAPAASPAGADGECRDRGARSQKIVWAREAGASAERQLADARSAEDRKLIASVYQKRGSAPEVRAAIEAECVTEKQQAAQAAALIAAGNALKGQQAPAQPTAPAAPAGPTAEQKAEQAAADARRRQEREAEIKKGRCDGLKSQQQFILAEQRAGGSAGRMDALNRQRQDLDTEMRKNGC